MLGRLRRFRWLAALLVVLSPPTGAIVLPALDPCPIDIPWLANEPDQSHHHGDAAGAEPTGPGEHGICHCVGACAGSGAVGLAAAGSVGLDAYETHTAAVVVALPPVEPASKPRFLLPPSHAPPLG